MCMHSVGALCPQGVFFANAAILVACSIALCDLTSRRLPKPQEPVHAVTAEGGMLQDSNCKQFCLAGQNELHLPESSRNALRPMKHVITACCQESCMSGD